MRSPFFTALLAALPLSGALLTSPAGADDSASPEALFDRGLADMKAGKYDAGCPAIAESQRLDPRPGTLFTLATCESEWGHIATAVSRFGDYLALYETLPDEKKAIQGERPRVATETRARLQPEVPQLTLSLPKNTPAGTIVRRNGEVVAPASLGVALPVDPGEYMLSTQVPDSPARELRLTIARGEKKQVTLEVSGSAGSGAKATSTPPPDTGPSGRRVATYVVGATGLAGLVVGGVLGGLAAGQKGTIDQHCGAAIGAADEAACDQTGLDAASSAQGLGLGSTVALAVGGAAVGAAAVLFFTEPRPAAAAKSGSAAPRRPVSGGAWVSAGVLSAGPSGARLGVSGAW